MKKRKATPRIGFTESQLASMIESAISQAQQDADVSWLPQTVVRFDDPDFPFRWGSEVLYTIEYCQTKGWTPVVTILPATYFTGVWLI